jgi:hypothetical protein
MLEEGCRVRLRGACEQQAEPGDTQHWFAPWLYDGHSMPLPGGAQGVLG